MMAHSTATSGIPSARCGPGSAAGRGGRRSLLILLIPVTFCTVAAARTASSPALAVAPASEAGTVTVIEAVAELLTVLQEKQLLQTGDATLRTRILQSVLDAVDCHGRLLAPTQEPDGTRRTSEMGSIGRTRTVGGVFRYVELLAIAEGTAADLRLSLADVTFGHYEGIILDLRSSAGTELKSAHQAVDVLAGSEER